MPMHTSTLAGGYTTGRADLITLLRQRARPYLFSNTLAPAVAGASLAVFDILTKSTALRDKLEANTQYFRRARGLAVERVRLADERAVLRTLWSCRSHMSGSLRGNTVRHTVRHTRRSKMTAAGFAIRPGSHPIVPIMLGDAALATAMAARMLEKGIYVVRGTAASKLETLKV